MRFVLCIVSLGTAICLSGCAATPYQATASDDGYSETRLSEDMFQVSFMGNRHTSAQQVQDFALLRAAEVTRANGFRWFAIVADERSVRARRRAIDGDSQTADSAHFQYATAVPSVRHAGFKRRCGFRIQCFKTKPEGVYVFDAALVAQSLKTRYAVK